MADRYRCGAASLLYLQPNPDEPNGNSELWQSSLMGTNHIKIADSVSDFYPQGNGLVVFKRRMSRSTHEMYWMRVDGEQEPRLLGSAMDYSDAAINEAGEAWAVIAKPGMGAEWQVEYGILGRIGSQSIASAGRRAGVAFQGCLGGRKDCSAGSEGRWTAIA